MNKLRLKKGQQELLRKIFLNAKDVDEKELSDLYSIICLAIANGVEDGYLPSKERS